MTMRNRLAITIALTLSAVSSTAGAADEDGWRARLAPVPIDPAIASSTTGLGQARAELRGMTLIVSGTFEGLQGPATEARLHAGPYTGVRGEAFADLEVTRADEGEISGSIELSAEQHEALRAGLVYVQLHSEPAPDGNLWGWLLP
jgi:hypothetical protein